MPLYSILTLSQVHCSADMETSMHITLSMKRKYLTGGAAAGP